MSLISEITAENYLKAIVKYLSDNNGTVITNGEIAKLLNVTPGTATSMVKKLEKDGYIMHKSRAGCSLTERGKMYGLNILRRHRLIETFLYKTLNMNWEDIHNEAENIEHAASDKLIDIIDLYLGNPERDPHGAVIPKKNQSEYIKSDFSLKDSEYGIKLNVVKLTGSKERFEYYEKINLKLGSEAVLINKNEASGLAEILLDGKNLSCSVLLLENIFVEKK
ncbi:metal-dependent transcriptional regulator [Treponema pedis]|uniref:metal-dependent transcriptional regulator n=1 Tax=Treponema pedis TaxID=409322 RepID=UPI0003FD5FB2|nr:metal-dependent transcriptional regulator [Treponema pedis]